MTLVRKCRSTRLPHIYMQLPYISIGVTCNSPCWQRRNLIALALNFVFLKNQFYPRDRIALKIDSRDCRSAKLETLQEQQQQQRQQLRDQQQQQQQQRPIQRQPITVTTASPSVSQITERQLRRQHSRTNYHDDEYGPASEVENDRQQRVYRGQPSTIGQVQRDRDGLRRNIISVSCSNYWALVKLTSFKFFYLLFNVSWRSI